MRAALALVLFAACSPGMSMSSDSGTPCGTEKTPRNLVQTGSFECGDADWSAQFGDFAIVSGGHSGASAGQLTATTGGSGQFGYASAVVASASGKSYCVNAWVRGTAPEMRIEVVTQAGMAFSSPVMATWLQAPPVSNLKVTPSSGDTVYLRFKIQNGTAGQTLLVDDVDFWESTSGNCDERH